MIYWLARSLVLIWVKIFYRHKVYGAAHLLKGGALIAANHCSFLDPPLVGVSYPGKVHFLARHTLFHPPLFAWLLKQLNTHPVSKGKGNLQTFKMAMELLEGGKKVVIFPEGHRSSDGELQEAHAGISLLVVRTGCAVIPTYIHGTYAAWNAHTQLPHLLGKTACVFGQPLFFPKGEGEDKKELQAGIARAIMQKIALLKAWYLAGAHGNPP